MEAIEVTAHFDKQGRITPVNFTWKGGSWKVESVGRRWADESGQHFLVMVANGRIYQLTYQRGEESWFIRQGEPNHKFV